MKILVTGANGQVGREICKQADDYAFTLLATDYQQLDITDKSAVTALIEGESPDIIINTAAYTAVDKAEEDAEAAKWYLSAATFGFYLAQGRIAYMYAAGEGVKQDFIEAYAWYHVAAQSDAEVLESRDWVGQQLSFMEKRKAKKRAEELLQIIAQYQ